MRTCCHLGAAIGLVAILGSVGAAQVRERDESWQAPPDAVTKVNPLAARPDAARGGAKLFAARCATCHGEDARGSTKGPDLTREVQAQSDGALFWKISSGNSRAGMPSFSFMPEAQRWQLVLRLRTLAAAR